MDLEPEAASFATNGLEALETWQWAHKSGAFSNHDSFDTIEVSLSRNGSKSCA
jgi:hypothetical protein